MKRIITLTILLLTLSILFLTSCSKDYEELTSIEQVQHDLVLKHGQAMNHAIVTPLHSNQLQVPTGVDYIEESKNQNGQFLAIIIEQNHLEKPILDHFILKQQLREYDQELDFALIMTIEEINTVHKKAKSPWAPIFGPMWGKCANASGGWDQCVWAPSVGECNPFVTDGCGVGVPDHPDGGSPKEVETIGGN